MDRAALTARVAELRSIEARQRALLEKGQSDLALICGAIVECEHWLAQMPAEPRDDYPKMADANAV